MTLEGRPEDYEFEPDPAVKPARCEECQCRTGYLYRTQVDSFGRILWLCGGRNNNCRKDVQDF